MTFSDSPTLWLSQNYHSSSSNPDVHPHQATIWKVIRSFNLLMPSFSCSNVMILSQGLLPLNLINIIESNFTLFGCRFCCTFSVTSPNFEMILNADEEICWQDKGGGRSIYLQCISSTCMATWGVALRDSWSTLQITATPSSLLSTRKSRVLLTVKVLRFASSSFKYFTSENKI